MALPIIPKKQFDVKSKYIPKGKVTLIPFSVGQEDLLIQVKDSIDTQEQMGTIKQVVQECIQNKDIDAGDLPVFSLEEIFIRLRQNSIGEIVEQAYQCTNEVDGVSCDNKMPIQIDLREMTLKEEKDHTNIIVVSDPIGIKFTYPTINLLEVMDTTDEIETIISCIDSIFDADSVYPAKDSTREELTDFWKQLTLHQKKDVYDKFFTSMPHMHYKKDLVCSKCNHKHEIEFNSLAEVFQQ